MVFTILYVLKILFLTNLECVMNTPSFSTISKDIFIHFFKGFSVMPRAAFPRGGRGCCVPTTQQLLGGGGRGSEAVPTSIYTSRSECGS